MTKQSVKRELSKLLDAREKYLTQHPNSKLHQDENERLSRSKPGHNQRYKKAKAIALKTGISYQEAFKELPTGISDMEKGK